MNPSPWFEWKPASLPVPTAFARMAEILLNQTLLQSAHQPYRLIEIEFYYYRSSHPDPFAHRHQVQMQNGRWYFHRVGRGYRGGSRKGIDLTYGQEGIYGGILFRAVETPTGEIIEGPSLLVDRILADTGYASVGLLDAEIAEREAWNPGCPVYLVRSPLESRDILATRRVGLRLDPNDDEVRHAFEAKRYRYITNLKLKKGGKQTREALNNPPRSRK